MQDEAGYKRTLKRVDTLEQIVEQQAENISSLIRAIKLISARLPRAAGSCDPFDLTMMDPHEKPYVLPPGLAEELSNPVHKWAINQLTQEEADIFQARTRLFWQLREMRSHREAAKKKPSVSCVKSSPGGAGEAPRDL